MESYSLSPDEQHAEGISIGSEEEDGNGIFDLRMLEAVKSPKPPIVPG